MGEPCDGELIGAVEPLAQHQPGDRLIHRAGVEERQVEPACDASPCSTCPGRSARRPAMTSGCVPSPITRLPAPSDACTPCRPTRRPGAPTSSPMVRRRSNLDQQRCQVGGVGTVQGDRQRQISHLAHLVVLDRNVLHSGSAAPTSENKRPSAEARRESPPPPGYTRPGGPHACREFSASPLPLVLGVREVIPTLARPRSR